MKYVLDASAIISGFVEEKGYTVPEVLREVRDYASEFTMKSLIVSGKLDVRGPSKEAVQKVEEAVRKTKDSLSETDVQVIALALDLDGCVVSGDYGIQNVCRVLGIPYVSVGAEGIGQVFEWMFVCVGCGREYEEYVEECPFCGNRVEKKRKG